ncbi:hypothetical protein JKP88DRAFT_225474 [Tribonema minus]|uniref:Uncharacterized protein n=1 Tax=Tribonema minus TaxID=303371 RepID=A0A835YPI2_9STRA|nr:hypothetical protein JKP88DRAFT_225474 [Tribonema minus]
MNPFPEIRVLSSRPLSEHKAAKKLRRFLKEHKPPEHADGEDDGGEELYARVPEDKLFQIQQIYDAITGAAPVDVAGLVAGFEDPVVVKIEPGLEAAVAADPTPEPKKRRRSDAPERDDNGDDDEEQPAAASPRASSHKPAKRKRDSTGGAVKEAALSSKKIKKEKTSQSTSKKKKSGSKWN